MTVSDPDNQASFEEVVVPSTLESVCAPKRAILDRVREFRFGEQDLFALKLALEEALTNAVKHGNGNDPTKSVTVRFAVSDDRVTVVVRDQGPGFEPDQVPDCTCPERLPIPNGRGIMLMRAYMDEVTYRCDGREVSFTKRRSEPAGSAAKESGNP